MFKKQSAKIAKDERGGLSVPFAVSAVAIIASAGVALDFVRASSTRTELQSALDTAVLAGAVQDQASRGKVAADYFTANVSSEGADTRAPAFVSNADGTFTGTVSATVPTTFAGLIGIESLKVGVTSTAAVERKPTPYFNVLDPDKWYGLRLRNSSNIDGGECDVHVHSGRDDSSAGFENVTNVEFKRVCLKGGARTPISNKEEHCAVAEDTLAGKLPAVSTAACDYTNKSFGGNAVSISPGVYCGNTQIPNAVQQAVFEPGLYVIKGGALTLNAKQITGNGVTFYFADATATLVMKSVAASAFSAPESGPYKGILMFQPMGLDSATSKIEGANDQDWTGIVHVPSWDFRIKSGANWNLAVALVANSVEIENASTWSVKPYTGASGTGQLVSSRLVK